MSAIITPIHDIHEARAFDALRLAILDQDDAILTDLAVTAMRYGRGAARVLAEECRDEAVRLGLAVGWLDREELAEATCRDLWALRVGALERLDPSGLIFGRLFAEYGSADEQRRGPTMAALRLAALHPGHERLPEFLRTARVGDTMRFDEVRRLRRVK